jgi:hypothetical protein
MYHQKINFYDDDDNDDDNDDDDDVSNISYRNK